MQMWEAVPVWPWEQERVSCRKKIPGGTAQTHTVTLKSSLSSLFYPHLGFVGFFFQKPAEKSLLPFRDCSKTWISHQIHQLQLLSHRAPSTTRAKSSLFLMPKSAFHFADISWCLVFSFLPFFTEFNAATQPLNPLCSEVKRFCAQTQLWLWQQRSERFCTAPQSPRSVSGTC